MKSSCLLDGRQMNRMIISVDYLVYFVCYLFSRIVPKLVSKPNISLWLRIFKFEIYSKFWRIRIWWFDPGRSIAQLSITQPIESCKSIGLFAQKSPPDEGFSLKSQKNSTGHCQVGYWEESDRNSPKAFLAIQIHPRNCPLIYGKLFIATKPVKPGKLWWSFAVHQKDWKIQFFNKQILRYRPSLRVAQTATSLWTIDWANRILRFSE